MGYEPTEQYIKETYGEGFRKKKPSTPGPRPNGSAAPLEESTDDDAPPAEEAELAEGADARREGGLAVEAKLRPEARPRTERLCPVHGRRDTAADLADARPSGRASDDAEHRHSIREADAIDDLVDSMLAEWEPALAPAIAPILALADECKSFDEFRQRLPELAGAIDTKKLEDLMARGAFAARVAGDVKLPLAGED